MPELSVHVEAEPDLSVRRFSIYEGMSRPFEVNLFVRSHNHDIDFEKVVNKPASFRIISGLSKAHEPERLWTGVCNHFEQLRPEPKTDTTLGLSTYYMRIVPQLWLLTQSRDNRIFRHKKVIDVVRSVLKEWDITPEVKLTRDEKYYKELEYVVQYEESDFDFVSRLLESIGVSYYFVHGIDTPTKLILRDEPHRPMGATPILLWEDHPTQNRQVEFVTHVRIAHKLKPGKVTLRDFDFHASAQSFALSAEAPDPAKTSSKIEGLEAFFEQYRYVPGGFRVKDKGSDQVADDSGSWPFRHTKDEGQRRAERELDSLRRGKRSVSFESNAVGISPGRIFSMTNHPRKELASDKTLLMTEYTMDGEHGDEWIFTGQAVFTDAPCVPLPVTPKPVIPGVQSAIVVGKGADEIDPDEFGRVKVQFHWDRRGKWDRDSSCWMRVSQQWAGSGFGAMFIPRVKSEVLVSFFEGDPDLPVVLGRAHNLTRPLPYKLPDHDRKTVWKTKTSPLQEDPPNAYNELRFDDTPDDELVFIQAQRDFQELVKRHEVERTGKSRVTVVGENRSAIVATEDTYLVGEKYSLQVIEEPDRGKVKAEEKVELKLIEQRTPEVKPLPTKIEMIDQQIMATTGDATVVMKQGDITWNAKGGEITFKAGGEITIFGGPDIKINS